MVFISIALLSISTITMMYFFPRCERIGNCPICSEKTFFSLRILWCVCHAHFILVVLMCLAPRGDCAYVWWTWNFFLTDSDVPSASRWSLGSIFPRSVHSSLSILCSSLILWHWYMWIWLDIRRPHAPTWWILLWMEVCIRYWLVEDTYWDSVLVCMFSIFHNSVLMVCGIARIRLVCQWEWVFFGM